MLDSILGNRSAQLIMLRLFRDEEVYAGGLAKDYETGIKAFQNQLEKFEDANLLVSRKIGNLRLYSFNPQSAFIAPLKSLIEVEYNSLSKEDKDFVFPRRKRPRRKNKPITKSKDV
ncbi:MAG: winged helix-turn-helix domain-containing protein [Halobacteriovoraceae bacterium]|nr:winged helix-turn-helix domain-containing protein [Halobacteriovoraceae bacterium]